MVWNYFIKDARYSRRVLDYSLRYSPSSRIANYSDSTALFLSEECRLPWSCKVVDIIIIMAAVFTKKVGCLSLSKFCRGATRWSGTTTVTAVDFDEQTTATSSSSNEEDQHKQHGHGAARSRRLLSAVKRPRTHSDTIIRERGIALLRNPQTNKVSHLLGFDWSHHRPLPPDHHRPVRAGAAQPVVNYWVRLHHRLRIIKMGVKNDRTHRP